MTVDPTRTATREQVQARIDAGPPHDPADVTVAEHLEMVSVVAHTRAELDQWADHLHTDPAERVESASGHRHHTIVAPLWQWDVIVTWDEHPVLTHAARLAAAEDDLSLPLGRGWTA
jgi:hypothetical protein